MNQSITVNGYEVRLNAYTEKLRSELVGINEEISEYAKQAPDWDEIPAQIKHGFWRRKAQVLWSSNIPESMYWDDSFEYEAIMEAEGFFLSRRESRLKKLNSILVLPITILAKLRQVARSVYGFILLVRISTKAMYWQISIQSWPCKYGINPPISLQRQL